ncbi:MAG: methionine--tRNA ligase [Candidatus Omnitrophota bacterium]
MSNKFYLTTPLYYVNAAPHIGHSYTNIAADSLARYMRGVLGEKKVWFLTGTDEHGQKIQRAADDAKLSPQQFSDRMVMQFRDLWKKLNISYNDFIRTTEDRHIKIVQRILEILHKKGDIYLDTYQGWYCTPCETFWNDSQIIEGVCPDCKRTLEKISESNYFFKLSNYQDWLMRYIDDHPEFIRPEIRRNEVTSFLKNNKLNDLCISRPKERLSWGIPLPFSPAHVTYVWFDALINYVSAVGEFDAQDKYRSQWWPADLHLIGKDILRQHAIYWPIILRALDIEQPKTIIAHGWWMIGEDKMSKSRGNVVSPIEMANKFGTEVYRYFLLREVSFGLDGNFSEEAIIKRFNSDLANDLGNLVYRLLTMVEKYYAGNIPDIDIYKIKFDDSGERIKSAINNLHQAVYKSLSGNCDFSLALEKIWELVNLANKYVEETKPWNLAKDNQLEELKAFIRLLVDVVRKISDELSAFMPDTAASISEQLGSDKINKDKPLFPRIEIDKK